MRNTGRTKHAMRKRSMHWSLWALLVLALTAGLAVDARAEYVPPVDPPSPAYLTTIGGRSNTVVIRLLNLTPYNVTQDLPGITAKESLDKERTLAKSFMFAPLGWPGGTKALPGLEGNWTQDPDSGDWMFTPTNTNTSTHPYNFVVSWDDNGGYVTDSTMGWTIKGVYASGHGPTTKDVPLRCWFTRVKPDDRLGSEIFKFISDFIVFGVDLIGVVIDPANPITWVDDFVATTELADGLIELVNSTDTGGDKMYFAAHTVPEGTPSSPDCSGCLPQTITKSSSGDTTDGVDVQWGSSTGDYSSEIVVTTHMIRPNEYTDRVGMVDYAVPIVNVTLWTPEQYHYAQLNASLASTADALGQRLKAALKHPDMNRYTQFVYLYKSLNPSQHRTLQQAIKAFLIGNPLTQQQAVFLEKMTAALEKGQTKLPPEKR